MTKRNQIEDYEDEKAYNYKDEYRDHKRQKRMANALRSKTIDLDILEELEDW